MPLTTLDSEAHGGLCMIGQHVKKISSIVVHIVALTQHTKGTTTSRNLKTPNPTKYYTHTVSTCPMYHMYLKTIFSEDQRMRASNIQHLKRRKSFYFASGLTCLWADQLMCSVTASHAKHSLVLFMPPTQLLELVAQSCNLLLGTRILG